MALIQSSHGFAQQRGLRRANCLATGEHEIDNHGAPVDQVALQVHAAPIVVDQGHVGQQDAELFTRILVGLNPASAPA